MVMLTSRFLNKIQCPCISDVEGSEAVPKQWDCRGVPDNDSAEEWSDSVTRNVATDCGASGNALYIII